MGFKKNISSVFIIIFFIFLWINIFQENIFSVEFGDETDNFVIANWINQGKILYKDIFYNHQPFPILLSSGIQKLYQADAIYSLIKIHRITILAYSAFYSLILIYSVGLLPVIIFVVIFELTKTALLGNLFLAESLVVYPVVFIIASIYKAYRKIKLQTWEKFIFYLSLLIIQLTFLPLTPFVLLSFFLLFYYFSKRERLSAIKTLIALLILSILGLSLFVSPLGYIKDTVLTNIFYLIPQEVNAGFGEIVIRIFFRPILVFFLPNTDFFLVIKLISALYIISTLMILPKKSQLVLIFFSLLITTNLRPVAFGTFKNGFHLLPFWGTLLWITILQVKLAFRLTKSIFLKGAILFLTAGLIFVCFSWKLKDSQKNINPDFNWNVNYSDFFVYGETVRLLSDKNDTLFTSPAASLIYWQSQLLPNSKYFFLLGFMKQNSDLSIKIKDFYKQKPPTFFYAENEQEVKRFFANFNKNYQQITKDKKPSRLFMKKDKLKKTTDFDWKQVEKYGFQKPELLKD